MNPDMARNFNQEQMFSKTRACGPDTWGPLANKQWTGDCVREIRCDDHPSANDYPNLLDSWRFYCFCVSGANDSPYHLDVSKNVFVFVTVFVTIVLFMFQALMALLITWTSQNVSSNQQISQQSLGSHGDGWS